MSKSAKFGQTSADHLAIEPLRALKDDNHAAPADEARALRNFESFASDFLDHQRAFLRWAKTQQSDD